ncbi:MAG: hypothetical protein FRX49_12207 [Trebouxia sp. A1-2]|nr:MAG: hypothetical protein FRX49_12207 [Trebouxia sp. A1-2]
MIAIQVYRADKPHAAARRGRSLSGDLTGDNPKEARVGARQQGDFPAQNRFSGIRQGTPNATSGIGPEPVPQLMQLDPATSTQHTTFLLVVMLKAFMGRNPVADKPVSLDMDANPGCH